MLGLSGQGLRNLPLSGLGVGLEQCGGLNMITPDRSSLVSTHSALDNCFLGEFPLLGG